MARDNTCVFATPSTPIRHSLTRDSLFHPGCRTDPFASPGLRMSIFQHAIYSHHSSAKQAKILVSRANQHHRGRFDRPIYPAREPLSRRLLHFHTCPFLSQFSIVQRGEQWARREPERGGIKIDVEVLLTYAPLRRSPTIRTIINRAHVRH